MAWTAEDRRKYAPAIQDMVRAGMIVRLARTIEAIDPQPAQGRAAAGLVGPHHAPGLVAPGSRRLRVGRRLPGLFPPHTTVWSRLHRWRELAVLDRALAVVGICLRLARGRKQAATDGGDHRHAERAGRAGPGRAGPQRGPRGYDAGKKIKGRKRVLLIDTEGTPLGVRVVPANLHEHQALLALAPDLAAHPTPLLIWLDRGFAGDDPEAFLNGYGITVEVVGIKHRQGAFSSSRGAGKPSRRSVTSNAIDGSGSTTR